MRRRCSFDATSCSSAIGGRDDVTRVMKRVGRIAATVTAKSKPVVSRVSCTRVCRVSFIQNFAHCAACAASQMRRSAKTRHANTPPRDLIYLERSALVQRLTLRGRSRRVSIRIVLSVLSVAFLPREITSRSSLSCFVKFSTLSFCLVKFSKSHAENYHCAVKKSDYTVYFLSFKQ